MIKETAREFPSLDHPERQTGGDVTGRINIYGTPSEGLEGQGAGSVGPSSSTPILIQKESGRPRAWRDWAVSLSPEACPAHFLLREGCAQAEVSVNSTGTEVRQQEELRVCLQTGCLKRLERLACGVCLSSKHLRKKDDFCLRFQGQCVSGIEL